MSDHDNAQDPDAEIAGEDIEFSEPQLGEAEISPDVAASVDLDKVAAEAAEVEREAERSAALPVSEVIGAVPAPSVDLSVPDDIDVEESTVLRTDFTKAPVANNPWTKPTPTDDGAAQSTQPASPESSADAPAQANIPAMPSTEPATPAESNPAPDAGGSPAAATAPSAGPAAGDSAEGGEAGEKPAPTAPEQDAEVPAAEPATEAKAAYSGRGIDDGSGWHRPETQWQPKANSWQSPGQVAQGVADAAALAAAQLSGEPTPGQPPVNAPWAQGTPDTQATAAPGQPPYGAPSAPGAQAASQAPSQPPYGSTGMQPPAGQPAFGATNAQPVYGAPGQHGAANHSGQPGLPGVPPVPPVNGYPGGPGMPGGPGQPGAPWQGGPGGPQGPDGSGAPANKNKLFIVLGIVIVGLVLLGLLVWLAVGLLTGLASASKVTVNQGSAATAQSTATDGANPSAGSDADVIIPQALSSDWLKGDCLRGVSATTITTPADVVRCSSPHSAQVVDKFEYGLTDTFPGTDAVKAKAAQFCNDAPITNEAKKYTDLKSFYLVPTTGSWDNGDRTVQCIVIDPSGDKMTSSLIQ